MRPDAAELAAFYHSPRGRLAARVIRRGLESVAPEGRELCIVGLGYATPFLDCFSDRAERTTALHPHEQGGARWPAGAGNRTAVVQETMLPLADQSVDVALLVHAVEGTDRVHRLLREVWRVLVDGGRLIIVAPNRRSLWSFAELTPFGHGRPYSASQLTHTLETNLFRPLRRERVLYTPPFRSKVWLRTAPAWERAGARIGRQLSGVIVVEAEKATLGAAPALATAGRRSAKIVPLPVPTAAARDAEEVPPRGAASRSVAFERRRRRG